MTLRPTHLLFVRTPSPPLDQDPYHSRASSPSSSFIPHHLPILRTSYHNISHLATLLQRQQSYEGVIVTSARSVQALAQAQSSITNEDDEAERAWFDDVPFFVVGQGTADALQVHLPRPPPKKNVLGADGSTGTGEKLANFIRGHFKGEPGGPQGHKWKMLYFVGDKNRDTIPRMLELEDKRFELDRFRLYETTALDGEELESEVSRILDEVVEGDDARREKGRIWLIFFSPSGAKAACKDFRRRGWIPDKEDQNFGLQIRIAAIGPVTRAYLHDDEGVQVDAVAQTPDAEHLLRCIRDVEERERVDGEA
ncbi:BQ2448_7103 [Microbotryum intermedium]|uniref:BQ2448_7103 protein n=1 Tax=Microbotryum intermedium TaxID=269621 RepID=A0A238FPP4_9BASI|nr:BQ2448_7103 [Microbotryum intermedium]